MKRLFLLAAVAGLLGAVMSDEAQACHKRRCPCPAPAPVACAPAPCAMPAPCPAPVVYAPAPCPPPVVECVPAPVCETPRKKCGLFGGGGLFKGGLCHKKAACPEPVAACAPAPVMYMTSAPSCAPCGY